VKIIVTQPTWAQQAPEIWWKGVFSLLREISGKWKISSIGFSGQMHSLVVLDEKDKVLRDAILWCDQRTSEQCQKATSLLGGEQSTIQMTGNPVLEGFTLGKLLWIRDNEEETYKKISSFLLPKDYIIFMLTGNKGIEPSDASGTAMYDVVRKEWNSALIKKIGLEKKIFPQIYPSTAKRGTLKKELAEEFNWEAPDIISGGADNAAAALGSGITSPGDCMVSIGTSGTVLAASADLEPDMTGRLHLFNHVLPDISYYMGVMLSAGNSLNWFTDRMEEKIDWTEFEEGIAQVSAGANGLIFLPYLNGERTPHRNPKARGVLFGISSMNSREDVYRAVVEGITFGLRDSFELIKEKTLIKKLVIVGGGAKNKTWAKIIATNFKIPVKIPIADEGAAFGAAMLAAIGNGMQMQEVAKWTGIKETVYPDPGREHIYDRKYKQFKGLYKVLEGFFEETN